MILLTFIIFGLIGLVLALGGGWLVILGGSPYYLLAGLGFLLTAALIQRRQALALWVYAALIFASLGWALWEVGFDWWQLAPRGGVIVLLGLWLLLPPVRRRLEPRRAMSFQAKRLVSAFPIVLAVSVSGAAALYAMLQDPHGIHGTLSTDAVTPDAASHDTVPDGEWHQYGRTDLGQRYSPLDQITTENVGSLELAWSFQTGDIMLPEDVTETTYQVTPLKVDDRLYLCTPHNWAIALDAGSGAEIWRFDPESGMESDRQHQTCRGVTYWRDEARTGQSCAERVYLPTADARLIALDAATGDVCTFFGDNGMLHLEEGMPFTPPGYYYSTSPPVAVAGKIIIGGAVNDNYSIRSQSGVIRAYDIDTGELLWNWDAGNPDDTTPIDIAGGETYMPNSPNSWSVFAVDEDLGHVYIPLGNQQPDQIGIGRSEAVETYSTSITALDIETGAAQWVFQTVHHDIWDYDMPAQPALLDLTRPTGAVVPALVTPTKQGDIYVLNRRDGTPLLPVEEIPAPTGAVPEDYTSPTQPVSALSFAPDDLREADMWGATMFDQLMCRINFHRLTHEGRYTPPSVNGTLQHPGNFGVFNWGSIAVDPVRQVMFGMPTYVPFTIQLIPTDDLPVDAPPGDPDAGLFRNVGMPYGVQVGPFLGPLEIPCTAPPWGYVAGADLRTGEIAWQHRNGTVRDMSALPLPFKMGVPGIGGPIITAGGVAFLGATVDDYLRAYDLTTGEQLWQARLPAGAQATPMTYTHDGKQYVLIVAGGHGSVGTTIGDYVLAFALP